MGKTTIEWTATYNDDGTVTPGYTFNSWVGCVKVSPGCKFCYAEELMTRKGRWANTWGPAQTTEREKTSDTNWKEPLKWNRQAEMEGRRARVFCASLADVFEDNDQLNDWRCDLWDLIKSTPNLDWLLLTKRPENVYKMTQFVFRANGRWQLPSNIWLGTSVENQEYADKRIPELLKIPAAIRFLSCEPLLGPVDLVTRGQSKPDGKNCAICGDNDHQAFECRFRSDWLNGIDWVIAGGESGSNARPFCLDWARSLIQQCQAANVAVFMKQLGSNQVVSADDLAMYPQTAFFGRFTQDRKGGNPDEWPEELRVREFPEVHKGA